MVMVHLWAFWSMTYRARDAQNRALLRTNGHDARKRRGTWSQTRNRPRRPHNPLERRKRRAHIADCAIAADRVDAPEAWMSRIGKRSIERWSISCTISAKVNSKGLKTACFRGPCWCWKIPAVSVVISTLGSYRKHGIRSAGIL